jgi:UDP-3-O-[3-hydroxymyristoyl] glucosamine N-acyltransferase
MVKHTLSELAEISGAALEGDGSLVVSGPATLREAQADHISFYGHPRYRAECEGTSAVAVVVPVGLDLPRSDLAVLRAKDASRAFTSIVRCFLEERSALEPGVHATAVVHPDAQLEADVAVAPFAVIGPRTKLARGVQVHAHAVLGAEVQLGEETVVHPGVVLYDRVTLGRRCVVHAGAVLGADGFGFEPTPDGWVKIPQVGTLVVGDDVEIGAGCTIDRGRFGPTRIGSGSKLDDQVHIGHNVEVGEHVMFAAQAGVAGSVRIGNRALVGGQVGISGHLTIGEGANLAAKSGVIGDVPAGATLFGYPARERRSVLKGHAHVQRLPRLNARVKELEARIAELERNRGEA